MVHSKYSVKTIVFTQVDHALFMLYFIFFVLVVYSRSIAADVLLFKIFSIDL